MLFAVNVLKNKVSKIAITDPVFFSGIRAVVRSCAGYTRVHL